MSDWEIGIIGFLAGASVVDLIWTLITAAKMSVGDAREQEGRG